MTFAAYSQARWQRPRGSSSSSLHAAVVRSARGHRSIRCISWAFTSSFAPDRVDAIFAKQVDHLTDTYSPVIEASVSVSVFSSLVPFFKILLVTFVLLSFSLPLLIFGSCFYFIIPYIMRANRGRGFRSVVFL